ncbi:hypothetical protein KAR91_72925 [Candidatus Pacearchaeota archaeon]|nr:hypothetical protein [Candidatus Pacearchaeota archaeon]
MEFDSLYDNFSVGVFTCIPPGHAARQAWDHQQRRIDELEIEAGLNAGVIRKLHESNDRISELEKALHKIASGYDDEEEGSASYYPAYRIASEAIEPK